MDILKKWRLEELLRVMDSRWRHSHIESKADLLTTETATMYRIIFLLKPDLVSSLQRSVLQMKIDTFFQMWFAFRHKLNDSEFWLSTWLNEENIGICETDFCVCQWRHLQRWIDTEGSDTYEFNTSLTDPWSHDIIWR